MKPLLSILAILVLASAPAGAQPDSSKATNLADIQSCKIVYKFWNGPQSGTRTLIFDDFGRREKEVFLTITDTAMARKIYSEIGREIEKSSPSSGLPDSIRKSVRQAIDQSIPEVRHQLKMHLAGETYSVDLDKNVGYKTATFVIPSEYMKNAVDEVEVGKDTILGKPCKIVEIHGGFRLWYWGKIVLKKELMQQIPGLQMGEFAIEIDENYPIATDEFKVPASVKMQ